MPTPNANDQIRNLIKKRATIKSKLTKLKNFFDSNGDINELEERLNRFIPCLDQYEAIESEIGDIDENQINEDAATEFENSYFKLVSDIKLKLKMISNSSSSSTSSNNTNNGQVNTSSVLEVRLPLINLPEFSGNYKEWLPFYDSFKSLIHENNSIKPIQKFHYLKSSLKGQALELLRSLETSSDNYELAWNLLIKRFDDKKLIAQNHLKSICDLNTIAKENHFGLRQLLDGLLMHSKALESLEYKTFDALIIYLITCKLDSTTKRSWEEFSANFDKPTFEQFTSFLTNKCKLLENLSQKDKLSVNNNNSNVSFSNKRQTFHAASNENHTRCILCKETHLIYYCPRFLALSTANRISKIKSLSVCMNCLRSNHKVSSCKSTRSCNICKKQHHTLLHLDKNPDSNSDASTSSDTLAVNHSSNDQTTDVILATALIFVKDKFGKLHSCRALLDSGSQANFIRADCVKKLGLLTNKANVSISGINSNPLNVRARVQITIHSRINNFNHDLSCLVLPEITQYLPANRINTENIVIPNSLNLADPKFFVPGQIDILIGAELFFNLLCIGQFRPAGNQPLLQKTQLGWILSGNIPNNPSRKIQPNSFLCKVSNTEKDATANLNDNLLKFWELESLDNQTPHLNPIEQFCETHFTNTVKRNPEGRFIVTLPIKSNPPPLGSSLQIAKNRLYALERKFIKNPTLKVEYAKFLAEYLQLGHMKLIDETQTKGEISNENIFYLPHHGVIKETSITTKLRVVFDGSVKSDLGTSLNDILLVGPTIQPDLLSIILRFRTHKIALTADIEKMYRQVLVNPSQTKLQRILWREDPAKPIDTYELQTVTYGTASAAFQAIRCLKHLADENETNMPLAAQILRRDFYVDDLLTGADSEAEALQIKRQLSKLIAMGKFNLHKWSSNSPNIVKAANADLKEFNQSPNIRTLGIAWDAKDDTFRFPVKPTNTNSKITKRSILSQASQIFDPMGLIGPVTITAKILIQRLWELKLSWDESVPQDIHTSWKRYNDELSNINTLKVPRNIVVNKDQIELHGFSDASIKAYGACIYVRCKTSNGQFQSHLLCAKSRVAPMKTVSLPRLELCGAVLLAQLMHNVKNIINCIPITVYYWTDSTICLHWLRSNSSNWKTFVAHRVGEIQQISDPNRWHHVKSGDNPADLISRGLSPTQLLKASLWWNGPDWLSLSNDHWPKSQINEVPQGDLPEVKRQTLIAVDGIQPDTDSLFHKYSNFEHVIRITAYCLRFIRNIRPRNQVKLFGPLSADELSEALKSSIKCAQFLYFSSEINALKHKHKLSPNSNILSLAPFLDEDGLLRVGGRLCNAKLPYDQKHPVLLSNKHILTKRLIKHEHEKHLHTGISGTIAILRNKYWIINARNIVKQVIHNCLTCFKMNARPLKPLMGNLPVHRIQQNRPFSICGIDFGGPFQIKEGGKRSKRYVKVYIAVFVCFASKAIHVELVEDLTSEACLNALKRFMSRRGKIAHIYSDNATNFKGVENELKKLYQTFKSDSESSITRFLSEENIKWHYIPARSPHFGGLWEAAIKSVKRHVNRVAQNAKLTFGELNTFIIQVEAILNSRPITPISSDPNDLTYLAPSHLLIGDSLLSNVEPDIRHLKMNTLSRWQYVEQLRQHFWARWHKEYLHTLQQRTRWKKASAKQLQLGDLVLIREENVPPMHWPTGRVEEIHPGIDGIVRAATIRMKGGLFKRAATRLCILPLEEQTI